MAYLIPAVLSFLALTDYRNKYFQYISPIYLIIAIYLYLNNSDTTIMYIFNETTNEKLGMVLCSVWIFILPRLSNQSLPSRQVNKTIVEEQGIALNPEDINITPEDLVEYRINGTGANIYTYGCK